METMEPVTTVEHLQDELKHAGLEIEKSKTCYRVGRIYNGAWITLRRFTYLPQAYKWLVRKRLMAEAFKPTIVSLPGPPGPQGPKPLGTDADDQRTFSNRLRILIWSLPKDAYPEGEREDNPLSAANWDKSGTHRITAFIQASDNVADAIWQAVLEYEGEGKDG